MDERECPVCMEGFSQTRTVTLPFACQHAICAVCDRELFCRHDDRCPQCRASRSVNSHTVHGCRPFRSLADGQRLFFPIDTSGFSDGSPDAQQRAIDALLGTGPVDDGVVAEPVTRSAERVGGARDGDVRDYGDLRRLVQDLLDVPGTSLAVFVQRVRTRGVGHRSVHPAQGGRAGLSIAPS